MIETIKVWYYREADTNPIIQTGAYANIDLNVDFAVLLIRGCDHGIEDFDTAEERDKYFKASYLLETYLATRWKRYKGTATHSALFGLLKQGSEPVSTIKK